MATEKLGSSQDKLVIPVAGAMNLFVRTRLPIVKTLSSAGVHFWPLRNLLEDSGWTVEEPIVPSRFGFQKVDKTHREVSDRIDKLLDKHPNKRAVLIAHSLGGLPVARYVVEHSDDDRILGGITVDTPHQPHFSGIFRGPGGYILSHSIDDGSFSDETAWLAQESMDQGHKSPLALIGTESSDLVDPQGSLPPIAGADRYLFTRDNLHVDDPSYVGIDMVEGPNLNHAMILAHSFATKFIGGVASEMFGSEIVNGSIAA